MDNTGPFDKWLEEHHKRVPGHVREALINVNDTLAFMWASARQVFGPDAKPEHAIALLPVALGEIAERGQLAAAEWTRRMEAAERQGESDRRPAPDR